MDPEEVVTSEVPEVPATPPAETGTPSSNEGGEPAGAAPKVPKEPAAPKVNPKDRHALIKAAVDKVKATNAAGRTIDPSTGRYLKADGTLGEKAPAKAPLGAPITQAAPAAPVAPIIPPQALNAPGSLQAAFKARWAELHPEWQAELARIDSAAGKAAQPYQEKVRQLDELMAVVTPHLPIIQAEGSTPARAIASLLHTAAKLRTGTPQEKQNLFMQLAHQYGVQLPQGSQPPGDGSQAQLPDIQAHPFVQQLAQTVNQLQGHLTQQQQQEQARIQQSNAKAVQDFQSESDGKGQPKYPLDDSLEGPFAAEIQLTRGMHPDWDAKRVLELSYENLTWKTPQLRDLRLKKQDEERKAKDQAELAAKKAAAVTLKGSGPQAPGPSNVDPKDRRAVIANGFASIRR